MQGCPLRLPLSKINYISYLMSLMLYSHYVNSGKFLQIEATALQRVSWQKGICNQVAP